MVTKIRKENFRKIKLFVEGGGDGNAQHAVFRENFRKLLAKAGFEGSQPAIVPCGGRRAAYENFCTYSKDDTSGWGILLVDSEAPVDAKIQSPWEHLKKRKEDGWSRPDNTLDEQCHLIVQCMETWFVADVDALNEFYGADFKAEKLQKRPDVENMPKESVFTFLEAATKECASKGRYSKGKHSFALMGLIDPARVRAASPWAERFFSTLSKIMRDARA